MKLLQETTDWSEVGYNVPNHIYALDNQGRLLGYIKDMWYYAMPYPMYFAKKARKFKDVTKEYYFPS